MRVTKEAKETKETKETRTVEGTHAVVYVLEKATEIESEIRVFSNSPRASGITKDCLKRTKGASRRYTGEGEKGRTKGRERKR